MSNIDLIVLARRESERVEWKEQVADIEDVIKTIVAFANDYSNLGGGYVVCGARETKDQYGFKHVLYEGLSAERLHEVEGKACNDCRIKVDPGIIPITEVLPVPGDESKRILIFLVPADGAAHSYRPSGKDAAAYYIRSGSNTIEARNGLLRELLIRKRQIEPWDRRICGRSTIEHIDLTLFREYLQEMKLWSPNKQLVDYLSETEKLSDFTPPLAGRSGLDVTLRLKNFAILMFNRKPTDFFEGAYAIFSIYKGIDRSDPFGERHLITGSIVQQVRRLVELLDAESYTLFDKTTDTPNQLKYPAIALKEAVVNALIHRDYESDQPVRVTVFEDRIEIFSPGGLPSQIDVEKFKAGKATAYWRNQALNYLFNRLQLAQAEGQGIPTILRAMRDEGCPPPIFEVTPESVTCILPAHPRHQLFRKLYEAEKKMVLRNYQDALAIVEPILNQDPYNPRALELFCSISILNETPEAVNTFIKRHSLRLEALPPDALLHLAEALTLIKPDNEQTKLVTSILDQAYKRRLEEGQLLKVVQNYKKLGENDKVDTIISELFRTYPNLQKNPALLQLRARARIDLAKVCLQTTQDHHFSKKMQVKARDQLRKYLEEAEKDLNSALDVTSNPVEKEWLLRDLTFLNNMKKRIKK